MIEVKNFREKFPWHFRKYFSAQNNSSLKYVWPTGLYSVLVFHAIDETKTMIKARALTLQLK